MRINVSMSHDNTSMYVGTVINFAKYHIGLHTTYYIHTMYILRTYYVQNEWSHSLLCWFQTNLPLAALPLCRVIIACRFRVAALSSNATLALSPSGIAPDLNRIQLSAICRGGQSGKVIDLLAWRCLPLGHPSAASQVALAQLNKYLHDHQRGNAAS